MNTDGMHIVAGGGPAGLMSALLLAQRLSPERIWLLEQSHHFGGLYSGFDYGASGLFDNGMHVLYETGIPEVDAMLHSLLPAEEWNLLEGNAKDIAGIYWNGALQTHSPYLDLRRLPLSEQENCARDLFALLPKASLPAAHLTAEHYLFQYFGHSSARHLIACLEKLHQQPASTLSALATRMPAMDRIILFDAPIMEDLMQSAWMRARLAYPEQLELPSGIRKGSQAALYPREFGMGRVMASMAERLVRLGVRCLANSAIASIGYTSRRISAVSTISDGKEQILDNIAGLYWMAGLPALGAALGLSIPEASRLPLPDSLHVNLRLNAPLHMDPLYHFYCFDADYRTFRVTNYAGYCPGARSDSGYPVCVELWPRHAGEISNPVAVALQELHSFGVIGPRHKVTFSDVRPCRRIHAMFTMERVAALRKLRDDIKNAEITGLMWAGLMAEDHTLLLHEILRDAYAKLQ